MSSDSLTSEMFFEGVLLIYSALRMCQVCTQELIMSTLSAKKLLAELMECLHDVHCKDERMSQWALSSAYHIHVYNIFPSRVVLLVTYTIEDDVFLLNVLKINRKPMWIVHWNRRSEQWCLRTDNVNCAGFLRLIPKHMQGITRNDPN